jgi:ABC-type glycerol-3-phosphate transport system substrate-binding protein
MKKKIAMLMAATLSLGTLMTAAGCVKPADDSTVVDESTVTVRLYKAGFGDEFIYELKQKFEAAYADKGY